MTKVVRFRWLGIGHLWVNSFFWIFMARKEVEVDKKKKKVKKTRPDRTSLELLTCSTLYFFVIG